MRIVKILFASILLLIGYSSYSQNRDSLFARAVQLEKEYRYNDALELYSKLLRTDSTDVNLLNAVSHLLSMRNYDGLAPHDREKLYHKAEYLSRKAISIDNTNALSHFYLALALGRLSDKASTKVKISYAREIRASCERSIMLNRNLAGPYHILGRWHQEVSGFNVFEKAVIATFYGKSLEGGTYEEALKNFKIALRLDPHNPIHHYEIAHTYYHRNQKNDHQYARDWLKKALSIPARSPEDQQTHKKAKAMLKKLGE